MMDAQTRVADTAALTALVQCLVHLEAGEGHASFTLVDSPRCSTRTASSPRATACTRALIDPVTERRLPVRAWLEDLLEACAPHAAALGCSGRARDRDARSPTAPGAARQRSRAGRGAAPQLGRLMRALHADFTSSRSEPAALEV